LGGEKVYIPKRPGEPDITFADTRLIHEKLNWLPQVDFKAGVQQMLNSINDWKDAPLWEPKSIEQATQAWFEYLG
ncbi:MAG: NAD-dependent dehydratase, partial [Gammaproteobacteria bacterium]|nr:NAD-dependent dehydratase [Gammaproteobacteria bacterium]